MASVEFKAISKSYGGAPVIAEATLSIATGEFLTLLGPSGCGKTTLLRIVAGLVGPDSGSIRIDGTDVTAMPVHRREIGMVFQAHALFPHMTVSENVGFGLKMRGIAGEEKRSRVSTALSMVRLEDLAGRMPHELSGGQQQRVAIARAIVIKPRVLLLDEPFGALDRKLRETLQVELREVTRALGITAIFVTHDQEEALVLSDRIAVMNAGRLVQAGPPNEIFEMPRTRFVADFMGFANLLSARVVQQNGSDLILDCDGVMLNAMAPATDCRAGAVIDFGIRRERIGIMAGGGATEAVNVVPGVIESSIYHGNLWSYRVATRMGTLHVTRPTDYSEGSAGLDGRSNVTLQWDKGSIRVFG